MELQPLITLAKSLLENPQHRYPLRETFPSIICTIKAPSASNAAHEKSYQSEVWEPICARRPEPANLADGYWCQSAIDLSPRLPVV